MMGGRGSDNDSNDSANTSMVSDSSHGDRAATDDLRSSGQRRRDSVLEGDARKRATAEPTLNADADATITPEAALLRCIRESDVDVLPTVEKLARFLKVPLEQFASAIKIPKAKVPRRLTLKPSAAHKQWLGLDDLECVISVEYMMSVRCYDAPQSDGEWWSVPKPPCRQSRGELPHCFLSELSLFMSAADAADVFKQATGVDPLGVVRQPSALDGASGGYNVYVKETAHVAQAVARSQSVQVADFRILYTDGSMASGSQLMRMRIAIDDYLKATFNANPQRFCERAELQSAQPVVRFSPPGTGLTVPMASGNRFAIPSVRNGQYPVIIAEGIARKGPV
uniref:Uncharacterized protein n=1 Tax=Neobodo designis TaxID=312471 RepID=A0A7S1R0A3_NEODS|mmetsp:Transcript_6032/g.19049  ORF Transcript_6032/g.19049 Transcript_6032/m.19049 type:complete len:339 (+) Transcript_6032:86-1102(+)